VTRKKFDRSFHRIISLAIIIRFHNFTVAKSDVNSQNADCCWKIPAPHLHYIILYYIILYYIIYYVYYGNALTGVRQQEEWITWDVMHKIFGSLNWTLSRTDCYLIRTYQKLEWGLRFYWPTMYTICELKMINSTSVAGLKLCHRKSCALMIVRVWLQTMTIACGNTSHSHELFNGSRLADWMTNRSPEQAWVLRYVTSSLTLPFLLIRWYLSCRQYLLELSRHQTTDDRRPSSLRVRSRFDIW